jgi:hypothetical protein
MLLNKKLESLRRDRKTLDANGRWKRLWIKKPANRQD